ncbi:MAG: hypothetical protein A3G32_02375 [Deltaproteobacteria bacterium RIFCSPLOWO2_12_FULL_40_28]|nr:MAG: hypothetical protein A3C45_03055 [Deltaproteobacteria bacterium RIFCSPHIGHO2_02_FULL_40_28]OGQ20673.1 MAG: hypothetical protein A3E27_10165 [Deltaproteobacteria bacterium RIFCSPHIGHO2_12_FULL_40_32]OGQ38908.1 MAG: hypothetical protein A3I69_08385 [Deltaproteobacteria bacterium RIFCSPLOWO2_02_FULL_40_36]OGQ55268.1 MAG: hypothetical protein A3G32_02375 [Deltaproteobacteria bacterium RIFCSPLOWO2_12_FULL_40_28]
MKKHLLTGLFAVISMVAVSATVMANGTPAPEAAAEGVEISGHVTVVTGYQHDDKDAAVAGGINLGGMGDAILAATVADADHFRFIVDEVELDLQKSFGENIRLRADLDFRDAANTNWRAADVFDLEQAYVTANLAAGNGIEFLIGKFNAPVGVDVVDRHENWLISYNSAFRWMTPTQVTGAKLYYAFNDLVDFHWAVVNDLNSNGFAADSAMPSTLFRLGFNWGEEGRESTVGISGGAGPENSNALGVSHNAHWDFFGDLDAVIALSDSITLAGEGVWRQTDSVTAGRNQKAIAGFAALNYAASDVWDVTFRFDYQWEINPVTGTGASTTGSFWNGGFEGQLWSGTVGAGYVITDGAKMKLEYRFDYAKTAGAALNSDYHSVLAEFAYTF